LNDQEYSKEKLLGDMSNMKDWATNLEKKYEYKIKNFNFSLLLKKFIINI